MSENKLDTKAQMSNDSTSTKSPEQSNEDRQEAEWWLPEADGVSVVRGCRGFVLQGEKFSRDGWMEVMTV